MKKKNCFEFFLAVNDFRNKKKFFSKITYCFVAITFLILYNGGSIMVTRKNVLCIKSSLGYLIYDLRTTIN